MNKARWQTVGKSQNLPGRVVVTGLGAVSAVGIGVPTFWQALVEGRSGIKPITSFDVSNMSSTIGGEVRGFDPLKLIEPRLKPKRLSRQTQFGVVASREAITDAGLTSTVLRDCQCGVVLGSALFNLDEIVASALKVEERGAQFAPATAVPLMNTQPQVGAVIELLQLENVVAFCISNSCTSGLDAITLGCDMIRAGQAEVVICGGTDAPLARTPAAHMAQAGMLSSRNDEPERASRPFDRERDNGLLAEGAGVVILESMDFALDRGATPYAEITGSHSSRDLAGGGSGSGLAESMRHAMRNARCAENEVDYISAWGCGDPTVDRVETACIKEVFKERAYDIAVGSIKAVTGNPLAAAGALQLIAAALSLRHSLLPPTANYEHADLDCDLDYIRAKARRIRPRHILLNGHGLGGGNNTLVLSPVSRV